MQLRSMFHFNAMSWIYYMTLMRIWLDDPGCFPCQRIDHSSESSKSLQSRSRSGGAVRNRRSWMVEGKNDKCFLYIWFKIHFHPINILNGSTFLCFLRGSSPVTLTPDNLHTEHSRFIHIANIEPFPNISWNSHTIEVTLSLARPTRQINPKSH